MLPDLIVLVTGGLVTLLTVGAVAFYLVKTWRDGEE
jgi:hypothetical protein